MNDFRGNPIKVGALVIYPIKNGQETGLVEIQITERKRYEGKLVGTVVRDSWGKHLGKAVKIYNLKKVVVVGDGKLQE